MGEIKSAREIAMEKVKQLDEATEEDRLRWKYNPEGGKLAVRYTNEDSNLIAELNAYEEKARSYVITGAVNILIRNISMPGNDTAQRNNKKAMDGLKLLKNDKVAIENVFSKIRRIFSHYLEEGEQQRSQVYESLKADFTAKVQQAMQQQLGTSAQMNIDIENQPQFQEEWRKVQNQLDSQYLALLEEYKQELSNIS
ncbi:hypothetical protein ACFLXD_02120 [Chloroflexota bacterium]